MKILIVGYGSMGRRRIRLMKKIEREINIVCVDSNPERLKQIKNDGFIAYENLLEAINEKPDLAFVCTSPLSHADIIPVLLENKIHTFTELNLSTKNYDKMIFLANETKTVLFMSSTKLYDRQVQKIKSYVNDAQKPLTYIYHVGQYLPDWHPWESYKDFFVGKKESNGCREIYAIQLPWLIETFGKVNNVFSLSNKNTKLDIDFDDNYITTFEHENGNKGVFVVDVVSRKAVSSLEIIGEDLHIFWNGKNDGLFVYDTEKKETRQILCYDTNSIEHQENYADNIVENMYLDEINDFMNVVYHHTEPKYSLEKDRYVLELIDKIEGKL